MTSVWGGSPIHNIAAGESKDYVIGEIIVEHWNINFHLWSERELLISNWAFRDKMRLSINFHLWSERKLLISHWAFREKLRLSVPEIKRISLKSHWGAYVFASLWIVSPGVHVHFVLTYGYGHNARKMT